MMHKYPAEGTAYAVVHSDTLEPLVENLRDRKRADYFADSYNMLRGIPAHVVEY